RPQGSLEGLGRDEVEVVCRLVQEKHRRPAELQQQNLESRLLTAWEGGEVLLAGLRPLIARQRLRRVLAGQAGAVFVTAVQDLQQRATGQIGSTAVLDEPTRPHARAEPRCARMRYGFDLAIENRLLPRLGVGAAESEQAQELRLARTVRPEHRDPIAEVRLEIERSRQTGQFQSLTV